MSTERKTRDLCQDDWQDAHPDEYFPNVTRHGTCAKCGAEAVLVARSTIEVERPRAEQATMAWMAEQGEYITRLSRLPWAGDESNVANIRSELESMLRVLDGKG